MRGLRHLLGAAVLAGSVALCITPLAGSHGTTLPRLRGTFLTVYPTLRDPPCLLVA